jgi:Domain of unknown function (DUF4145)
MTATGQISMSIDTRSARRCIRAKAYKAAAVMAGRTLEGACELHKVVRGSLHARLAEMKSRGLIDGRLWEWADALRSVRNVAAHYSDKAVSRQDAEDVVAFSEALLDYLYVFTARFGKFKARRSAQEEVDGQGGAESESPEV